MRKRVIALALSMVLLCAACGRIGGGKEKGEGQYSIWFRSISVGENGAAIGEERQSLPENGVTVESLMGLLLAGPEAMELTGPFPRNTFLRSWRMEGDTVFLDLSEAYGGLSGADLSLADGCIVLTLCQLPQVEQVYLTVEGRPRPFRDQVLRPEDFLLTNGGDGERLVELRLWFRRGESLAAEERPLTLAIGDDPAIAALQALLAGPENEELEAICEPEATLLSLTLRDGCYAVDLSQEWLTGPEGGEDPRRFQAIVDTLAEVTPEARAIFLIEGQRLESFGGLDLTRPLAAREKEG